MPSTIRLDSTRIATEGLQQDLLTLASYWETNRVLADLDAADLQACVERITTSAAKLSIDHTEDLAEYAPDLLRDITGKQILQQFTGAQESRRANADRNILTALVTQIAINNGANLSDITEKMPTMMPENGEKGRAAHEDEILLCRITALNRLTRKRSAKIPGIQYILVEAGALPSETTVITWNDFTASDDGGLTVSLPGVGTADTWATSRTILIPPWAAAPLENALRELLHGRDGIAPTEPIAYRGQHVPGGHKASASASGNISRIMTDSGLAGRGLTGASPNRWRLLHELRTNGFQAAQTLAGKPTPDALLTHLQNPALDTTKPKERTRGNIAKRAETQRETNSSRRRNDGILPPTRPRTIQSARCG